MMLEAFTGATRNVVTFLPTDFDIELFRLTNDPHHQERFTRRKRMTLATLNCEALGSNGGRRGYSKKSDGDVAKTSTML